MPGEPDFDGACRNCGQDEYVCNCPEADLIASAVYYVPHSDPDPRDEEYIGGYTPGLDDV